MRERGREDRREKKREEVRKLEKIMYVVKKFKI